MAKVVSPVTTETTRLLEWFRALASDNGGLMPPFTNADAIADLRDGPLKSQARAHGNVQSRLDFACYRCDRPPLGLTADAPFRRAWGQQDRTWPFPVAKMQAAAQSRSWTPLDFEQIAAALDGVPLSAKEAWTQEWRVRPAQLTSWAHSFDSEVGSPRPASPDSPRPRIVWARDELILALDLYLRHGGRDLGERHEEIVALSELLNKLGAVLGTRSGAKFRNPNGVAMKLMNFRRHDPAFTRDGRRGLAAGNKLEKPVWDEFANDRLRLASVVASIRDTVNVYQGRTDLSGEDEPDITEATEGKVLTRLHRSRERSRRLVEQARARALRKWGSLACVGCSFRFDLKYGAEASHIIECHHVKPVSTLAATGEKTRIDDLALLCANCHRVVHSRRPWLSIAELRQRIAMTAHALPLGDVEGVTD